MEVEDPVDRWFVAGRRCHPEIELDEGTFRRAVRAHAPADVAHAEDLFLAVACAHGDSAALQRFETDYLGRLPSWLRLPRNEHDLLDEIRQRVATRALVARESSPSRMSQYAGRGPLWAWVRIIALREHARLRRELGRQAAIEVVDEDELEQLARSGELSADLLALRGRYQTNLMAAFRAAIAALSPRNRTLLRLAYVDALSLDAIGRMYGVNKSTVSRWLATCRSDLLASATERLRSELGLPADDVESLLGLMPRDLDVSLHRLLQT